MEGGGCFTVTVTKKEVVAAILLPLQKHWLPLSNLDLLLPALDVSLFLCYKKKTDDHDFNFGSIVGVLKKAMSQALVTYYVFAGEILVRDNSVGEPELLCNNHGVDFMEAHADVCLQDLNLYNPDLSIEGKLVPKKYRPTSVLSVQVTELKCGGVVVGCTFDHRIADAYSFNMFLVSWSELAKCKPLSIVPSFERSLLNPRRPGSYHPSMNLMYGPISALPPPRPPPPRADPGHAAGGADLFISRIYYVAAEQLNHLQTLATGNSSVIKRRTKLESFSAFLWKMVSESSSSSSSNVHVNTEKDNNYNKKMTSKMGIVVDGRRWLSSDNIKTMASYFGNVLSIPFNEKILQELKERPLSWVADAVHECLKGAATKDHFLELIDWVEAHRPEPVIAKIYGGGGGPAFVVSSGQRFPVSKVDFGWGRAVVGSYHFPWGGHAGYVMPMPSPARDGDWLVYMHLLRSQIEFMETKAAHFFTPLTAQYLHLIT